MHNPNQPPFPPLQPGAQPPQPVAAPAQPMPPNPYAPPQAAPAYAPPQQQYAAPQAAPAPAPQQYAAPAAAAPPPGQQVSTVPSMNESQAGNSAGRYLPDGNYVFHVTEFKAINGFKGTTSILNFAIAESDNPAVAVGGEWSWAKRFDGPGDPSKGMQRNEIKGFVCQLVDHMQPGTNASQRWTEPNPNGQGTLGDTLAAWAYQSPSPAVGTVWFVSVWTKPQKKDPSKGTSMHEFEPMQPGETRGLAPAQAPAPGGAPWA